MQEVSQIGQRLGRKAAFRFDVSMLSALVEKVLQVVHTQGVQIKRSNLRLDMAAGELFVAAKGRQLHGRLGVFFWFSG